MNAPLTMVDVHSVVRTRLAASGVYVTLDSLSIRTEEPVQLRVS